MDSETLIVVDILANRLEALAIPYYIGGSIASSLYGEFRATNDVDIVLDLAEGQVNPLVAALETDFYVDADMIRAALQYRSSFNVIYLPTMIKADFFAPERSGFIASEFTRRLQEVIRLTERQEKIYFASPEDMILQKLRWYRETGERSDRQWGDVQGMLKVQGEALDRAYMQHWADELKIADLLTQSLTDAGFDQ